MYFHRGLFFRALDLAFIRSPFSVKRWAYVLFFVGLFAVMWLIVAAGRALDHLLFPGFRKQAVRRPLFIVAPPRSGTTFTQKLLCLDEERFVHSKLFHTILPSITLQKLLMGIIALDTRLGAPLQKGVRWAERTFFGGWDDYHRLRLNDPEEDDGYFVYTFVTEAIFLLFPYVDELWEAGFADALPASEQRKLMRYYKSCLQRQLYLHGPDKQLLSKSTQFPGAMHALMEAFPDARFVTIVRHPYESVPSHISLFYMAWQRHSPELSKDSAISKAYGRLALEWYRHLHAVRPEIPPERFYTLDFRHLTRQPAAAMTELYRHFGYEMSPQLREAITRVAAIKSTGKSHRYSLEEFGLSREWIQDFVGEIMDTYSLEREPAPLPVAVE